ncbi:MAG: carboxypeptidase regulatory-like domain-containing protein [Bacteroidetes bacterium]|nr:carboxypeptidase regulatory-like domain-containing protein [Bacteroidota bacterium]
MRRQLVGLLLVLGLFLIPALVLGQTATIRGKVRDSYGRILDSVKVQVKGVAGPVYTDEQGDYELKLPPGKHFVDYTHPNFKARREEIQLAPSETLNRYINLGIATHWEMYRLPITKMRLTRKIPTMLGAIQFPLIPSELRPFRGSKVT